MSVTTEVLPTTPPWWKRNQFLLALIPLIALSIKIFVAIKIKPVIALNGNLQGGGWIGADGENYLSGTYGLIQDGFFSKESLLTYWPAGYPLLIWLLAKISITHTMWLVSAAQSFFYAFASYYFIKQLFSTKLARYTYAIAIIIAFNPTLSLSSLVVGYESGLASCAMMVLGLIIAADRKSEREKRYYALGVGGFFALAALMQPRWILVAAAVGFVWAIYQHSRKSGAMLLMIVIALTALSPALLIFRNIEAGKGAVISQNLGITMSIGAGDTTTGSYARKGPTVPCEKTPTDNQLVGCVVKWYAHNPVKGLKLFVNKSFYFWSPWSGPIQDGTMARNPWHKINPLEKMSSGSYQGNQLVEGVIGKTISWIWLLGGISLFFLGFFWLRSLGGSYRLIAWLAASPVLASWLVAMGTIGDHRFRLPTMPLSLFLQVLGFYALKKKAATGTFAHIEG